PSACASTTTSHVEVESWKGQVAGAPTSTPVGVEGCDKLPFLPTAVLAPETSQSDLPDGVATEIKVPQNVGAGEVDTADVRDVRVTLPEGMTVNPPAARG